jgi:hypothetical protein
MRRLSTLLLCLLTASGATAGSASASRSAAPKHGLNGTPGSALSVAPSVAPSAAHPFVASNAANGAASQARHEASSETSPETSREVPGVDPVWAAEATVAVRPAQDGATSSHAGQHQAGGMVASTWPAVVQLQDRADSPSHVAAGWSLAQRGYHATGPPASGARVPSVISSTISTHPMARPA